MRRGLNWKKVGSLALISLFLTLALTGCGGRGNGNTSAPKQQFLTVATASPGGTYYPIGVGLANLWSEKLKDKDIRVSAQSSAGSVENVDLLQKGEAQLGIFQGLIGVQAYEGRGRFEGRPYEGLRSIVMLWPNVEHFVLVNSAVKTGSVTDIKGTKFSIGPRASGTEESTLVIMKALDINPNDISAEHLGYSDTASAIKDGRIQGGSMPAGIPVSAITDLYASQANVTILEFTDEQLQAVNNLYNTWFQFTIPPNTYPGVDKEIKTIAQPNWLGVADTVDEETVYLLTKTIFENLDAVHGIHDSAKNISLDTALKGLPVPLHPGAYRYFKEKGLDIPEKLIPPGVK